MESGLRNRFNATAESSESPSPEDTKKEQGKSNRSFFAFDLPKTLFALLSFSATLSLTLLYVSFDLRSINIEQLQNVKQVLIHRQESDALSANQRPVLWVRGKSLESGYLKHVFNVFEQLGYRVVPHEPPSDWNILWTHEYPFSSNLSFHISHMKPYQRLNHVPGAGYITNKVSLATGSYSRFIPKAFRLPAERDKFLDFARDHSEMRWVQKSNDHRGIVVKTVKEVSLYAKETFVQEYISKPMLVDGFKFDIGIYVIMTSLMPLRVYMYEGDALLRFCAKAYGNEKEIDSYVVGDDYLPIWKIPSLAELYTKQSLSMKEALNHYLLQKGKDPSLLWSNIKRAIAEVYAEKNGDMERAARKYDTLRNFFEMVRFDFMIDEEMNVYLLEANMSPNLSSAHFKQNAVLYEQVIYSLLSVTGLTAPRVQTDVVVSDHDIQAYPAECASEPCNGDCFVNPKCALCIRCLDDETKLTLKDAYREHVQRHKTRRVLPFQSEEDTVKYFKKHYQNRLMWLWFAGMCQRDLTFCS